MIKIFQRRRSSPLDQVDLQGEVENRYLSIIDLSNFTNTVILIMIIICWNSARATDRIGFLSSNIVARISI